MKERKIGIPLEGLAELSRIVAAEGAVLLKNNEQTLPFVEGDSISVFGRCQKEYYRSGTGSGGAVHVPYTTNLLDSLRRVSKIKINERLAEAYETFIQEHPFDNGGGGWAAEPWHQAEMPLTGTLVREAAACSNKALVVIGRTAGEDKDNADEQGSYRLTIEEEQMLEQVCGIFDQVVLALNVSNIIDLSWLEQSLYKEKIKSIIYLWHGGMEGGNAAVDVLCGSVTPSGKLTDTIAYSLSDYPSTKEYGNRERTYYTEDIYVGYRYFETFAPEQVQIPFGFGLSYTEFLMEGESCIVRENCIEVSATVQNKGHHYAGKEVVQVYLEAPQGRLGRPARQLVGFAKTGLLSPGERQTVCVHIPLERLATYDDSGVTGHKSCYVLEAGEYKLHVGSSIRCTREIPVQNGHKEHQGGLVIENLQILHQLQEAVAPEEAFQRIKPGHRKDDGRYGIHYEPVPLSTVDLAERIEKNLPEELPITGDKGIKFQEVRSGKATIEQFVAQLQLSDLAAIVRGEGMGSTKVTPGTAAAFGGVTHKLLSYGIPVACAADGPSGIRMDTGFLATQLPIGTLLACTWDTQLVKELFSLQGQELVRNEIDTLLGPGINVHRNPLNGRNFEYFSEDPLVTGSFAAAVVAGIAVSGAVGTMKHYACNNQETGRQTVNAVISERALREVYLKGFEMGVKEGGGSSIMTAYNPVNGHWTASHYDLNTTILRKEWGYTGIVMTDWWAQVNNVVEGGSPNTWDTRSMVRSQNDLYMVVNNHGAELNPNGDNTESSVAEGKLTIGELQRCAMNILGFLLQAPVCDRPVKVPEIVSFSAREVVGEGTCYRSEEGKDHAVRIPVEKQCGTHLEGIQRFSFQSGASGIYGMHVKLSSEESNQVQMICHVSLNGKRFTTLQTNGTGGQWRLQKLAEVELENGFYELELQFVNPGIQVEYMDFVLVS